MDQTLYGKLMPNESYREQNFEAGTVAYVRGSDPGKEMSQSSFFITLEDIDPIEKYVVVGKVTKGLDQLKQVNKQS
jgi:cyclophilin family peptidyl-prolyl cis-trans isomerase